MTNNYLHPGRSLIFKLCFQEKKSQWYKTNHRKKQTAVQDMTDRVMFK